MKSTVASLRDLVPIRPLTREETLRVAELQAHRFHTLLELSEPPVPEGAIAELPRLQVERLGGLPFSGYTDWALGRWLVILNADDDKTRQRFSLAHELKHILDHRFVDVLYRGVRLEDRQDWIEKVCEYFAGCLLAPRSWVKRLYCSGIQRPEQLAARFEVSPKAMRVRLNQIGLTDPGPRCGRISRDWTLQGTRAAGSPARYQRVPVVQRT